MYTRERIIFSIEEISYDHYCVVVAAAFVPLIFTIPYSG